MNDVDVFTKALNGAEMGRMVPRLYICGYLNESRRLPVPPIGQHKVTSDAVDWYGPSFHFEARQADTYAASVIRWNKQMAEQDYDSNEIGSAIDWCFRPSPSEVYVTLRGVSRAVRMRSSGITVFQDDHTHARADNSQQGSETCLAVME